MDLDLHTTAPPIVVGDEALAFLEVHVGHGAERLLLSPIVDHMVFGDDGRITGAARLLRSGRHPPRPRVIRS